MATYNLQCTCGHTMSLDASSQDEAVSMFKAGMDQAAVDEHFGEHHKGEQKPTLEQVHGMIGQMVGAA